MLMQDSCLDIKTLSVVSEITNVTLN